MDESDPRGKFGEPWHIDSLCREIMSSDDRPIEWSEEREDRAVECVNACDGIANPAAIGEVIEAAKKRLGHLCNDTCDIRMSTNAQCTCGHIALSAALARLAENPNG